MGGEGAGRRLNDEEAARGAEMFAAGASERDVAEALGCSPSTAHRLRERLQGAPETSEEMTARLAGTVIPMRLVPGGGVEIIDPAEGLGDEVESAMRAERLAQLRQARDGEAGAVSDHEDRAGTLRQAISADEAEWAEGARTGRGAQELRELRQRIRDAADDLAAEEVAIGTGRQRLAVAEARISEAEAEIAAAEAERIRQAAGRQGDAFAPRAAVALREAVTGDGPVRALADLGAQLERAEAASGRSWDAEVVPPGLPGHPRDEWHRAVWDLWRAARRGDVAACQAVIPRCQPWQDRDPEEIARMAADVQANGERMRQLALENAARMRAQTPSSAAVLPELPNPLPGAIRSGRTGW